MKDIQPTIVMLEMRLEHEFGKNSIEKRLLQSIVAHFKGDDDLTHDEEICLALAKAYDN